MPVELRNSDVARRTAVESTVSVSGWRTDASRIPPRRPGARRNVSFDVHVRVTRPRTAVPSTVCTRPSAQGEDLHPTTARAGAPGSPLGHGPGLTPPGGAGPADLRRDVHATDLQRMTSSASSAAWLPAAIARAVVVTAPPARLVAPGGRHAAPEVPGLVEVVTSEEAHPGRHAEPEWSREVFDPERDEAAFEWLGFTA